MSRRESRASLGARQNDALYEFETFKKKFLLANKHITKLNSTLSVRIEELNAQIHALSVENLRLRASEIQLSSELKREREKSRKIMADAEAATLNLTRHLNHLRSSLDIPQESPTPLTPPSPKARRRPAPSNPNPSPSSPQAMRLSRPPNVPGIYEDEEPAASSSSELELEEKPPTPPKRKSKPKARLSASSLPLPTNRALSPSPPDESSSVVHMDLSVAVTSHSFAKRKAMRRQSGLLTVNTSGDARSVPRAASPAFGSPVRLEAGRAEMQEELAVVNGDVDLDIDEFGVTQRRKSKESKEAEADEEPPLPPKDRKRRREEDDSAVVTVEAITWKLKDVTNRKAAASDEPSPDSKQFLAAHPSSRDSSSPGISGVSEPEASAVAGGREKRNRKSVNYAEPKLNTKMRKPDPPPGSDPQRKKRSSAAAVMDKQREECGENEGRSSLEQATSSQTLPLRVNGHCINPESFPLPPSRPGSSLQSGSSTSGSSAAAASSSSSDATNALRRKKSRPKLPLMDDDDESDGADADAEYVPSGAKKGWGNVNVEGRKKIGRRAALGAAESEGRRHSMAV